jgi:DNA polymerase (family 10)
MASTTWKGRFRPTQIGRRGAGCPSRILRGVRNSEIADTILALGILYEIDGADRFRVLAYREGAKAVRSTPLSLEQMAKEGRLTEIDGIGKTLATKISDLIETGEIPALTKLEAKYPATLVEVTRLPGLGAKTVRRLFDELDVTDLETLRKAAEGEKIRARRRRRAS